MSSSEAYARLNYEFGPSKEKEMAEDVKRLTQLLSPYLESFHKVRIQEKNFPTDLERFVFLELRDKALEAVEYFRNKFKPGDHPDPIFEEKLAELKDNLQIQRLKVIGIFVEKELQKSNQKTYQEAMIQGAARTLKHILDGKPESAQSERKKTLHFQMTQQLREEMGVMAALGIPVQNDQEKKVLAETNKQVMTEADKPFDFLIIPGQQNEKELTDEARSLAAAMDKHYSATNALVNKVVAEGIQVLDEPNGVMKDRTFTPDASTGVKEFRAWGSVEGTDWGNNPFVVEIDEVGAVKNPGSEKNNKLVVKNVVGVVAADRLITYAASVGVLKEQVLELFLLATRQDAKNLLNMVKTFCDTLLGQEPVSLSSGLKTFADLSVPEKKVFVDALCKANAGWKVSPEDEAIFETLQEMSKPDNTKPVSEVFNEKAKKRIGSGAMGSFVDMIKAKGWAEVAKDLFQICQGLIQLEVGTIKVGSSGEVENLFKGIQSKVNEETAAESLRISA